MSVEHTVGISTSGRKVISRIDGRCAILVGSLEGSGAKMIYLEAWPSGVRM